MDKQSDVEKKKEGSSPSRWNPKVSESAMPTTTNEDLPHEPLSIRPKKKQPNPALRRTKPRLPPILPVPSNIPTPLNAEVEERILNDPLESPIRRIMAHSAHQGFAEARDIAEKTRKRAHSTQVEAGQPRKLQSTVQTMLDRDQGEPRRRQQKPPAIGQSDHLGKGQNAARSMLDRGLAEPRPRQQNNVQATSAVIAKADNPARKQPEATPDQLIGKFLDSTSTTIDLGNSSDSSMRFDAMDWNGFKDGWLHMLNDSTFIQLSDGKRVLEAYYIYEPVTLIHRDGKPVKARFNPDFRAQSWTISTEDVVVSGISMVKMRMMWSVPARDGERTTKLRVLVTGESVLVHKGYGLTSTRIEQQRIPRFKT